jgi:CRP-like cAMP-binding protein
MRLIDRLQHPMRGAGLPDPAGMDEAALVECACHDGDLDVRARAVDRLASQASFRRVALEGLHLDARLRAIGRIDDERILSEIMRERKNPAVMVACFARIHDPAVLGDIARDPRFNIAARRLAVQMFSQRALLGEVLEGLAEPGLRSLVSAGGPAEGEPRPEVIQARVDRLVAAYPADSLIEALAAFRDAPGAVQAMGLLLKRGGEGAPRAAQVLTRLLRHARPRIRLLAARALEPMAADLQSELAAVAENDPDPRVRETAAGVLGQAAPDKGES